MPFDSRIRATEAELMDSEDCSYDVLRDCLRDLAAVNRLTLGYRPTLAFLDRMVRLGRTPTGRPIQIVDVGSGYGDTLREIARWSERRDIAVRLTGVDINPFAVRAAFEASKDYPSISWIEGNVFDAANWPDGKPDIVLSALFTHHLDDEAQCRLLRWMEDTAQCGWFVNDLLRHPVSYWGFMGLSRVLRWHRFVRHDGPLSIARAFRRADWERALGKSGLGNSQVRIESWFPFRLCVARVKSDAIPD